MLQKVGLKIGSLNIQGSINQKITSPDILDLINSHEIFCFLETWLGPNESCPSIDGYISFRSERKNKHKKARRSPQQL